MADAPKPIEKHEPPRELPLQAQTQKWQGRAKRNPEDQAEYFYNLKTMHIVFLLSSLLLLAGIVGMVMQDWTRTWKVTQGAYQAMDLARVENELLQVHEDMKAGEGQQKLLSVEIAKLRDEMEKKKAEISTVDPSTGQKKTLRLTTAEIRAERDRISAEFDLKQQAMNFVKSDFMTFRWRFEEAKHHYEEAREKANPRLAVYEEEFNKEAATWKKVQDDALRSKAEFDAMDRLRSDLDNALTALEKPVVEAEAKLAKMKKEFADRLKRVKREMPQPANSIRNMPGLDFFAPTLKVEQVILSDTLQNLNFCKVERIDRCHTCHRGIENPTYAVSREVTAKGEKVSFKDPYLAEYVAWASGEADAKTSPIARQLAAGVPADDGSNLPSHVGVRHGEWGGDKADEMTRVLAAHPRLDLYVGGASPHPLSKFGCTVCHAGDGRQTEFSRAVHIPEDEKQAAKWKARHHYEHRELWDEPMLPKQHVYASCRKCHQQSVELEGGEDYVRGMKLYERLGCYACHRTDSYQILPKDFQEIDEKGGDVGRKYRRPGPPLTHVADKTTPAWAYKWILSPKDFRLSTRMPHFFGQSNSRETKSIDGTATFAPTQVEAAIVSSIVAYVFDGSASRNYGDLPATANPPSAKRGEAVFQQVGCRACHTATPDGDYPRRKDIPNDDDVLRAPDGAGWYEKEFGPNLSGMGSKVNAKWLYAWLVNPKHYFAQTRMGNFRLSEQEAVDVVEYLMSLKKKSFDERPGPGPVDPALLDKLVYEQLRAKMPDVDAKAAVKSMDAASKPLWFGRKMVQNYGCFSCHELRGENTPEGQEAMKSRKWLEKELAVPWHNQDGIGVELTGSQPEGVKAVDRLAFGYAEFDGVNHRGVSFEHPISHKPYKQVGSEDQPEIVKVHESRHDWIRNKLLNPRIFDAAREKTLPPDELLKMPNFYLTPEEARLLTTFVLSFSDQDFPHRLVDKVKKRPSADEQAVIRGQRLLRESNCRGCHRLSLDRFLVEFTREEGGKRVTTNEWVEGRPLSELPAAAVKERLKAMGEPDADAPNQRLFTFKWSSDSCSLEGERAVNPSQPWVRFDGHDWWYLNPENKVAPRSPILVHLEQDGGEILAHITAYKTAQGEEYWFKPSNIEGNLEGRFPPMLRTQGIKTQADWLFDFLKHPTVIRQNMNIPLPDVRDSKAVPEDVKRKVHDLVAKLSDEDEDVGDKAEDELKKMGHDILPALRAEFEGATSVTTRWHLMSAMGIRAMPDVNVRMPTFGFSDEEAAALARYFATHDQLRGVDTYPHASMVEKDPDYVASRWKTIDDVRKVDIEKNCVQCHFYDGKAPPGGADAGYKMAPDFAQMERRFRARWLHAWLGDPGAIYPGTTMTKYQWDDKDQDRDKDRRKATIEFILNFRKFKDQRN